MNNLRAIQPKSFVPRTTTTNPNLKRSPNLLLDRQAPCCANEVWVGDITYLPLADGQWAYLAVFMDLWSRVIVGWHVDDNMEEKLVIRAFNKGLERRQVKPGLILHTDGGSQYGSIAFRKILRANECEQSMTRKDNHYDNAFSESLFSRFKAEVLEGGKFLNLEDARAECFEFIDAYYNTQRKHSSLGNKKPLQFESEMENCKESYYDE